MKHFLFILGIVLLFSSCKNNKETYKTTQHISSEAMVAHPGKKAMETHCYVCHAPKKSGNQLRIAPPMVKIQEYYIDENTTKEQFTNEFMLFMENPTLEKAKMKGAVKKYGLMPYQKFPEGVLEEIADYLYENNPMDETPRVMKGQRKQQRMGQNDPTKTTLEQKAEIGLEYALETKQLLGQNLMGAIQKEGTLHALEFCNIEAIPLTKQMEEKHDAIIKRVSDKNRNPNNAANEEELYYINYFKNEIAAANDPKPIVLPEGNKSRFYYPIVTNSMCLQCHGKPGRIDVDVLKQIKWLYPNDLATGYEENEVRGIWSIVF
jgi:hypothetical protein